MVVYDALRKPLFAADVERMIRDETAAVTRHVERICAAQFVFGFCQSTNDYASLQ